ncbi:hypothetical protein [Granulicella aggregans]|jgi:hypothetical protein|uniref:hypothetical protein n=1 Tax=Granulicella aggregans TaxID=474949 RepID=UPI0021DF8FE6|nr:hypothetical protein [Granulicella aggregans]
MKTVFSVRSLTLAAVLLCSPFALYSGTALHAQSSTAAAKVGILNREQAAAILPEKVFYRGLSAPIQARNSGGVRFADSKLILAALVDTSGYSTAVKETYQAYLITEVPLMLGDKTLAPGAYGFGFIADDKMVVLDLGANQLFTTTTTRDAALPRPNPLQVLPDPGSASRYRLYLGRSYVTFEAAPKQN